MHPSRQALLKGNSSSYDSPPHISSQNRSQGQQTYGGFNDFRQPSGSFGGAGGLMGSSTNTIPLAGRGRWGGGTGGTASPAKSNVSFENNVQGGREEKQQENKKQGGWGERSGGQVGLRGSRTDANGGGGGDIWQTIPVEDDSKVDQGWGTHSNSVNDQGDSWGTTDTSNQHDAQPEPNRANDGWGTPSPATFIDTQNQSSGWDIPAPRTQPKPRSNASSQRSSNLRQSQNRVSPQQPQNRFSQQAPHLQEPMVDIQTPIRTESSGWYDYASPPPSFSKASQHHHAPPTAASQPSGVSGWGGERQNRAIQIKDPNAASSTDWGAAPPAQSGSVGSGGWRTPTQKQDENPPASPISVIQQQSGWDVPKPEESIQRWTREVGRSKQGEEDEVDGMDIEDTGGIKNEDEDESVNMDSGWGEKKVKVDQWVSGSGEDKTEEAKVDDGWGNSAGVTTGWGPEGDDNQVQTETDSGWGQAPKHAQSSSGWGKAPEAATGRNDNSGWGQPDHSNNTAPQSNDDGWGTAKTIQTTDRETAQAGRSPMDQRQPITQAAKGMIQRHLQNPMRGPASMRSTSGEGPGRRSGGVNNLPQRPAPQSDPFDVAAGDIWSSLPAVDDDEVIKPLSDSESESGSDKGHSSKASSMKNEKTRFRPDTDKVEEKEDAKRKIGRMSLASSDDVGSIHARPANKGESTNTNTPISPGPVSQPQPMLIDFDAPEEPYPPMNSAPSSTLTYSSTLIDMDDMFDLKTPITSPDRKVIGLDQYHPSKDHSGGDFASMAGGRGFQNALDLGQLAKMFENGYPVSGRQS